MIVTKTLYVKQSNKLLKIKKKNQKILGLVGAMNFLKFVCQFIGNYCLKQDFDRDQDTLRYNQIKN